MEALSPVNRISIKLFARSFFKANSGFLVFLFGILVSYCFFINTAGDVKLITPEELTFYHFIFVVTFISSPLMTILIYIAWIIYSVKSWAYICQLIDSPRNQFLSYSVTSLKKGQQFKNWFIVQLAINIPLIGYWIFSMIFGVFLDHYLLLGITLVFIVLLTTVSALIYYYRLNRPEDANKPAWTISVLKNFKKPYPMLFLYNIMDKLKIAFLVVKLLSLIQILFISTYYHSLAGNSKIAALFALTIVSSHTYLFYRHQIFEDEFLGFIRNFPLSRVIRYRNLAFAFIVLIIPESIWLFAKFSTYVAATAYIFAIGAGLLFRCLLYYSSLNIRRYFQLVFFLYFTLFLFILYDHQYLLAVSCISLSFIIFYKRYYTH